MGAYHGYTDTISGEPTWIIHSLSTDAHMSGLHKPWEPLIGENNYYKTRDVEKQYQTNDLVIPDVQSLL